LQVALLNNLRAGRSGSQVARILGFLTDHPEVLHVETESAAAVPDAIASIAEQQVDLLVVNGGDGTLQHALTEILAGRAFDRLPMIAPLRGGRTNMTALDLGAHRDPVGGLAGLLEAVRAGTLEERIVPRPVLRVAFDLGRRVEYGTFFGAGMIHRAIRLTHRRFPTGRTQGVFGAGVVTATLIGRAAARRLGGVLQPDKVQVLVDGEPVPQGEFLLLIASSLQRLFLRMNPFWGKGPGGVRFSCIASRAERLAAAAPGILRGRPAPFVRPEAGYISANAERVELRLDCGFTIDGEIFAERPDEVVTLTADRRISFVRA
jgi:diacylglycerol kinase family enzyme